MAKKVIVAPLNWGLGHATRCIPVVKTLLQQGTEVVIAGNSQSLSLLEKQFPSLESYSLPGFNPSYPAQGKMTLAMLKQLPKFLFQIEREKIAMTKVARKTMADVIISDNRYGARTSFTKNIFISHQLNIQVPDSMSSYHSLINKWQATYINRFDECWVPDTGSENNLAGKLVQSENIKIPLYFTGILSAINTQLQPEEKKYDVVAVLSGPEPQRSMFEGMIIDQLSHSNLKTLVVRGRVNDPQPMPQRGNMEFLNYASSDAIASLLHKDTIVIARSGYSTIMDMVKTGCKAILVPTPGQTEQEYLATYLSSKNYFVVQQQSAFNVSEAMQKTSAIIPMNFTASNNLDALVNRLLNN
ncbi:MAG: undecaprenyldiphospho-muramoylpentapeptide beta-N- acetylglucosaminyltransferase [Bacteroidetes bacterium ADurb.Bin141]|nr:MAG: undecaprenyldiphospho-muramoylpentapeptide beta-N- acetylglucosaminyltransferase [Bacteroidetes bacterium ADurb.Bin141]